ncbi:MAG: hypothetical protein ACRCTJ_01785 [Brevinema sp.]
MLFKNFYFLSFLSVILVACSLDQDKLTTKSQSVVPSLTSGCFTVLKSIRQQHGLKIREEYFYTIDTDHRFVTRGVQTIYSGIVQKTSPDFHLHGRRFNNDVVMITVSNGSISPKMQIEFPIRSSSGDNITDSVSKNKEKASFHFIQEIYTISSLITKSGREERKVNSNVSERVPLVLYKIKKRDLDLSLFDNIYDGASDFYYLNEKIVLERKNQ